MVVEPRPAEGRSRFQSLSGFLMSCNVEQLRAPFVLVLVSIPIGFSNEL